MNPVRQITLTEVDNISFCAVSVRHAAAVIAAAIAEPRLRGLYMSPELEGGIVEITRSISALAMDIETTIGGAR